MKPTFYLSFNYSPEDCSLQVTGEWNGKPASAPFRWPDLVESEDKYSSRERSEIEGKKIFEALFPAKVLGLLEQAREEHRRELLLRLSIPARLKERERLEKIPWEYALDPATDGPLGLSRRLILIRDIGKPTPLPPLEGSPPVRILVAWADPVHDGLGPIGAATEVAAIRAAWGNKAHVFELPNATFPKFCDRVRELSETDRLHLVHFIGHGGSDNQEPDLAFEKSDRSLDRIPASDFATQLEGRPDLRLVVLSSCKTAKPPQKWSHDPNRSFAYALLRRGISAVVATRSTVTNSAAEAFAAVFHTSLARGEEIEVAAAEGRRRIAEAGRCEAREGIQSWAIPVLYCQAADGALFQFEKADETDPLRLTVTTVDSSFDRLRRSHTLSLSDHFSERRLKLGHSWSTLHDRVVSFIQDHFWMGQQVELRLDAFLSVSFTAGFCLGTRGIPTSLLHTNRRSHQVETWRLSTRRPERDETKWVLGPVEGVSSSILAVAVSISQPNVLQDVKAAWPSLSDAPAAFLHASTAIIGHDAILDADHAWNLAEALVAKLKDERQDRDIHLFMAVPATFAFYLGQACGFLGDIQLYEFDGGSPLRYAPSILVTHRDRIGPGT